MASVSSTQSRAVSGNANGLQAERPSSRNSAARSASASHASNTTHTSHRSSSGSSNSKSQTRSPTSPQSRLPPTSPRLPSHRSSPGSPRVASSSISGLSLLDAPSERAPSNNSYTNRPSSSRPISERPPTIPPKDEDVPAWQRMLDHTPRTSMTVSSYGEIIDRPDGLMYAPYSPTYNAIPEERESEPGRESWSTVESPQVVAPTLSPPPKSTAPPSVASSSGHALGPRTMGSPPRSHKSQRSHGSQRSESRVASPTPSKPQSAVKAQTHRSSNSSSTVSMPRPPLEAPIPVPALVPIPVLTPVPIAVPPTVPAAPTTPTPAPRSPTKHTHTNTHTHTASPLSLPQQPVSVPRTLDDVRSQVAASTALRAIRKAQLVDGTKVGVVMTLSKHEDEKFLLSVAGHLAQHVGGGGQAGSSPYVFAIATSPSSYGGSPPRGATASTSGNNGANGKNMERNGQRERENTRMGASSLLLCGSTPSLVRRAVMLACAKFLSRVEEIEAQPTCWLGLVHDPAGQNSSSSNTPSTSSAGDEDTLWDVVRRAAITQSNAPRNPYTPPKGAVSIDDVLARARGQLERLSPQQAYDALLAPARATGMTDDGGSGGGAEGGGDGEGVEDAPPALLIDIRPASQRAVHGGIHGSLLIERNVLEWRLDPRSAARLSIADRYDLRAIVLCQEGYTSSLAAAALQEIGLWNATDVVGGYEAWKNAGLPTELNVAVWEGEEGDESEDGRSEMAPSSLISGTSMGDGVNKQGW